MRTQPLGPSAELPMGLGFIPLFPLGLALRHVYSAIVHPMLLRTVDDDYASAIPVHCALHPTDTTITTNALLLLYDYYYFYYYYYCDYDYHYYYC